MYSHSCIEHSKRNLFLIWEYITVQIDNAFDKITKVRERETLYNSFSFTVFCFFSDTLEELASFIIYPDLHKSPSTYVRMYTHFTMHWSISDPLPTPLFHSLRLSECIMWPFDSAVPYLISPHHGYELNHYSDDMAPPDLFVNDPLPVFLYFRSG